MKRRYKKLRRIARYYEQQKNLRMVELQKALGERVRERKKLQGLESRGHQYLADAATLLEGRLNPGEIIRRQHGNNYYRDSIRKQRDVVEDSVATEKSRRQSLISASLTCRIWSKLVNNHEILVRRKQTRIQEGLADDLALLHARASDKQHAEADQEIMIPR
ncbi:MAG: hypothetical protein JXB45_09090 [Candidatus Krumholzibacteriota bacterium]|nr:hypothetical protein [Candidatus Krumholzibacteriota bacterium]